MLKRLGLATVCGVMLPVLVAAPALADTSTVTVDTATEAWYHTSPPTALTQLPATNPYGAETLHVGTAAGAEESRIYLSLDLGALAATDEIQGGTLHLPLAPADSTLPEEAHIQICLARSPGDSVQGSFGAPPSIDCSSSTEAIYVSGDEPAFVADLTAVALDLRESGLALVAGERAQTDRESWHVAFYAEDNEATATITADLAISSGDSGGGIFPPPPPVITVPGPPPPAPAPPPPPNQVDIPTLPPQTAPPPQIAPSVPVAEGFSYSIVWALPLVLLALGLYLAKVLTRAVEFA